MTEEIKVLIVDDQTAARMALKRLSVWNPHSRFTVAGEAKNGQEALQLLGNEAYGLVITDIRMPVMDGLDLLQLIVKNNPDIPVILQSDHADFEYARKGLVYGAFDYLLKPVTAGDLSAVLSRVAEERLLRSEVILTPEQISKQIYQRITSGRALTDNHIRFFIDSLKKKYGVDTSDDDQWIRCGVCLFIQFITMEFLHANLKVFVNPAVRWALRQPDAEDAFRRMIRFSERAYGDIMLPTVQNDLVRRTVQLVLMQDGNSKTVGSVAESLFVHRNHLSQTFSRLAGITLVDYIVRVKMYQALVLLLNPMHSIQDVGELLGYRDDEHFSKLFREHTGMLPRDYRKQNS